MHQPIYGIVDISRHGPSTVPGLQKVVLVAASRALERAVRNCVEAGGHEVVVVAKQQVSQHVASDRAHLIVVGAGGSSGLKVCQDLREQPHLSLVPVIVIASRSSELDRVAALDAGALDYITMPTRARELRARIAAALRTKQQMDALAAQAMIDGLTGLWNRSYFDTRLLAELSLQRRTQAALSCVMADLDHFKVVNDCYGHPAGDEVIRQAARAIRQSCRREDIVCRYGGEEFAIILPNTNREGALVLAERMRGAIEGVRISYRGRELRVTCSFGVADLARATPDIVELADAALYQAKKSGRNRVACAA